MMIAQWVGRQAMHIVCVSAYSTVPMGRMCRYAAGTVVYSFASLPVDLTVLTVRYLTFIS